MLRKLAERLERIILCDMVGGFLAVMIPFVINGAILIGFIYMEAKLNIAMKLLIVWAISTYIGAIMSFKFIRWWFKKKKEDT